MPLVPDRKVSRFAHDSDLAEVLACFHVTARTMIESALFDVGGLTCKREIMTTHSTHHCIMRPMRVTRRCAAWV